MRSEMHDQINPCDPVGTEHEFIWLADEKQETPTMTVHQKVCRKCGSHSMNTPTGLWGMNIRVVDIDTEKL
jgi:hypothetical protein